MKARRSLIALALLAVYLLMTAGTAAASLSCECLASPVRAAHLCNHGCPVSGAEPVADGMFGGVCCDDLHSTDIELYLSASDDAGKCVRCVVTDLPPALAACPEPADMQALRPVAAERRTPFVTDPALPAVGFRAPSARG